MSKITQRSFRRRFSYAALGAVALFVMGVTFNHFNGWSLLTGGKPGLSQAELNAQTAQEARQRLEEQVANWHKDPLTEPPSIPTNAKGYFQPPVESAIPNDEFGASVRRGKEIFTNTGTNAREFIGNGLACANCHLDGGRRANAAPMWAAAVSYPKFRGKNQKINTMEDRINGCFTYSMNAQGSPSGGPPPPGHQVYKDLQSYFFWLADGAPLKEKMPGSGYPSLEETKQGYDWQRGEQVFADNCAVCHGENGQGQKDLNGRYIFPPLWGPHSYNWGAGMHRVNTAAGFIKANMPLGKPNSLSDQQAWDVAAYINSFPRPADPRQANGKTSLEEAMSQYHQHMDYYGEKLHGVRLGEGATPARWQRFIGSQEAANTDSSHQ